MRTMVPWYYRGTDGTMVPYNAMELQYHGTMVTP